MELANKLRADIPRLRGQQRREKQKLKQRRGDEEWEESDAKIWEGAEKKGLDKRESKEQNEANENYSGFKYWKDVQIALMIALNKSTGTTKMIDPRRTLIHVVHYLVYDVDAAGLEYTAQDGGHSSRQRAVRWLLMEGVGWQAYIK